MKFIRERTFSGGEVPRKGVYLSLREGAFHFLRDGEILKKEEGPYFNTPLFLVPFLLVPMSILFMMFIPALAIVGTPLFWLRKKMNQKNLLPFFFVILICGSSIGAVTTTDQECFECHTSSKVRILLKNKESISLAIDREVYERKDVHASKIQCQECHQNYSKDWHPDITQYESVKEYRLQRYDLCKSCHEDQYQDLTDSIHFRLLQEGNQNPPVCTDCHKVHEMMSLKVSRKQIVETCAHCHSDVFEIYRKSAHGLALVDLDNQDVPTCIDCHAAHKVVDPTTLSAHVASPDRCATCHNNAELMKKYNLSADVYETYLDDFHGMTVGFYQKTGKVGEATRIEAVCVDCHGSHDIRSMKDDQGMVSQERVDQMCQKCHAGIPDGFSKAWLSHYKPSLTKHPLVFAMKAFYLFFVPFTLFGLAIHIFLHTKKLWPHRRRKTKEDQLQKKIVRFNIFRRVEHAITIVSFFALVITGLPQKFYQTGWAFWVVDGLGGIANVKNVHRFFGALFSVMLILHLSYALYTIWIRRITPVMAPTMKDVRDALLTFRFYVGLTKEHPKFGRFDYRQKFEYWGMIVGGILMITTGIVLWNPVFFASILPAELIPVSRVAHSNEAFLAFMIILFWHLYSVTLNPEVFPFDSAIFTGKISEDRMKHEHPLEYEEWKRRENEKESKISPTDSTKTQG